MNAPAVVICWCTFNRQDQSIPIPGLITAYCSLTTEETITEDDEGRRKKRSWLWPSLSLIFVVLVILIVPPLVSLGHFKGQITNLMASSVGRPVRLSAVSVRLLPRPEFVLDDLTVEEDPGFGSEPVLHANTVTAPIRLLSLWRGRVEISEISVDEASVNLVRMPDGRWNLDPLLQTKSASGQSSGGDGNRRFPYLEATNSRVNFKNGIEKLPFSIINADLSAWESNPGEWRLRLRGQPVRTDVSLETADTGIVELDATARRAPELQKIPVQLDLEWRDGQLGQLSRLITGSDAGWRGDLRGDVHVEGTADAAHITTRLRATGVHRIEFAPAAPMDFDANCSLIYHYSQQAVEKLICDSPLGDGRLHMTGDVPGGGVPPHYSLEVVKVPAGAGLDALRTFRSGVDPGLQAAGTVSGKIDYTARSEANPAKKPATQDPSPGAGNLAKKRAVAERNLPANGPLTGSFTVTGLQLSGGGLTRPLQATKLVLEPTPAVEGQAQAMAGSATIAAGGPVPLAVDLRLGLRGYQVTARGQIGVQRGRELAEAFGLKQAEALKSLAGEPLNVELDAEGPWLPPDESLPGGIQPGGLAAGAVSGLVSTFGPETDPAPKADSLHATVTIRNANWKADFLANHVQIAEATLRLEDGATRWDPIDFTYGPLKGTATVTVPKPCDTPEECPDARPQLDLRFGDVDAAILQSAMLGAREQGTLLSDLIARLHPSLPAVLPQLNATLSADSLALGPVSLDDATAQVRLSPSAVEIVALDAKLLGGTVHASGTVTEGDKPDYSLVAKFEKLNPAAVGQLMGETWRGGTFDAGGKIELSGYTGSDLASSAAGTLHFDWKHGVAGAAAGMPSVLSRFDQWSGDAAIADGKIMLDRSEVTQGSRKRDVTASVTIADPPKISFSAAKQLQAKR